MVRPLRQGPSQPSYPTAWPCSGAGTGLFIFRGQPGCPGLRPSTRRKTSRGVYVRRSFSTRSPRLFTTDSPGGKNRSCRTDRMVFPLALPLLPSKDQLHVVTTKGMQTKEYTTHNTHNWSLSLHLRLRLRLAMLHDFVSSCRLFRSRKAMSCTTKGIAKSKALSSVGPEEDVSGRRVDSGLKEVFCITLRIRTLKHIGY